MTKVPSKHSSEDKSFQIWANLVILFSGAVVIKDVNHHSRFLQYKSFSELSSEVLSRKEKFRRFQLYLFAI